MPQSMLELTSRFRIPRFEAGPDRLIRAAISNEHADALIYLLGAHVAEYRPAGQPPLLFMSEKSWFEPGKPIRGGVPVIFPWFGPRAGDPAAPMHGFVRGMWWAMESAEQMPDGSSEVALVVADSAETRKVWPWSFLLRFTVNIGTALKMALEVVNTSAQPFTFEEALHTYFLVGDVREIAITGLAGAQYLDRMDGMKRKTQDAQPIRITCETDRLYLNTNAAVTIDDASLHRRITVEKANSLSTVVWNPWIDKARAMPDFGDDEWPRMVCVETANAKENAITLQPEQTHTMTATIRSRFC